METILRKVVLEPITDPVQSHECAELENNFPKCAACLYTALSSQRTCQLSQTEEEGGVELVRQ